MFENVCSYPLASDLLAQAIHPTESVIAAGLASGHVLAVRLPDPDNEIPLAPFKSHSPFINGSSLHRRRRSSTSSDGQRTISVSWKTRRHKGSCRAITFDQSGSRLLSAGTDGIVKIANTETGQVAQKIVVPGERGEAFGTPSLLSTISQDTLVLATDDAALHVYDLRSAGKGDGLFPTSPAQTHRPHDDYVSSLTPLMPTGGGSHIKQWVTTGGTTLAVTDARRGVLVKSEDQDEELLCSTAVRGLSKRGTSVGEKIIVGGADGVLTLWERGVWDDQDERIVVDAGRGGGESLDALVTVPTGVGTGKELLVGMGDGQVKVVRIGANKVVTQFRHDDIEGVVALGFDPSGRAISGGGQTLKVWQEWQDRDGSEDDDNDSDPASEDEDDQAGKNADVDEVKRERDEEDEEIEAQNEDEDEDASSEEDEPRQKPRKKKQRRGTVLKGDGSIGSSALFQGLD